MKWPVTLSTPGGDAARRAFLRGLLDLRAGRLDGARRAFESAAAIERPLRDRARRLMRELDGLRTKTATVRARRLARLAREGGARPLWTPEAILAEIRLLAIAELQRTGRFEVRGWARSASSADRRHERDGSRDPRQASPQPTWSLLGHVVEEARSRMGYLQERRASS